MHKAVFLLLVTLNFAYAAYSQKGKSAAPLVSAIKESDLKTDLFEMAGDHFRGREAGTLDELKVSTWWATKLQALGLKPAGDDGTYFQFFSMKRSRVSNATRVTAFGQ